MSILNALLVASAGAAVLLAAGSTRASTVLELSDSVPASSPYVSTAGVNFGGPHTLNSLMWSLPSHQEPGPHFGDPAVVSSFFVSVDLNLDGTSYTALGVSAPARATANPIPLPPTINQYATEMLSMNITGGTLPSGYMFRESPTLVSPGTTTAVSDPGGFLIDSRFDLNFELSTDGGQTWVPANGAMPVETMVPEPAAILLLMPAVMLLRQRSRKA